MGNRAEDRIRRGEGGILPEEGWGECGPRRLFAPKKVHVFSRRLRSEGVQGASGKPPASNIRRSLCRKQSPMVGPDAPTPARVDGAAAPTGDSTFFRRERKYQRKHAARRLREKALYCPFWRRGSLCRAQRSWPATPAIVRARSSPFSAVKMGGPFSLRCLSPLCPGAVGGGQAYPLRVGMLRCSLEILRH